MTALCLVLRQALSLVLLLTSPAASQHATVCGTVKGQSCGAAAPVLLQKSSRRDAPRSDVQEEPATILTPPATPPAGLGLERSIKSLKSLDEVHLPTEKQDSSATRFEGPIWRPVHWGHELPLPDEWGFQHLFRSVQVYDWSAFVVAVGFALALRYGFLWQTAGEKQPCSHVLAFVAWLGLASAFAAAVFARFGQETCMDWIAGYWLELFFMIENVFIFRSVVHALQLPDTLLLRTLNIVAWGQIMFEAVFFMGLAHHLRRLTLLPHLLGLVLLYFGLSTLVEAIPHFPAFAHSDHGHESSVATTVIRRISSNNNFGEEAEVENFIVFKDERWRLSVAGAAVCVLLLTDFMFEIDTVLTKIEEIPNPFVAFSSSALAAFALPELFMLSQDLLFRFPLVKYGIGAVLCMFGVLMMLAPVVVLHPFLTCLIMFGILLASMALSALCGYGSKPLEVPTDGGQ